MSNHLRRGWIALLALALLTLTPTPASAALRTPAAAVHAPSTQARFGGRGFGRRLPLYGPRTRYGYRYRPAYRRSPFHGLFRGVLRAIGLAYLFHLLFG